MAQEVRSSQSGTATFDFSSQAGVMKILQAIRQSDSPLSVKNELRDLVFSYANTGGDPATRNVLEEQLQAYNIKSAPITSSAAKKSDVHHGFAAPRPTPKSFSTKLDTAPQPPVTATAPASSAPATKSPVTPITPRINTAKPPTTPVQPATPPTPPAPPASTPPTPTTTPPNSSVPPAPVSPPAPTAPPQSIPVQSATPTTPGVAAAPAAGDKAPTPSTTPSPAPQPASTPAPPSAASTNSSANSEAAFARIKIIKGDVNKTFGNPVNVVDIDNTVGREYMSALLEAMKILPSGSPIAVKDAMERLESVYAQVKALTPTEAADTPSQSTPPTPPAPPASTPPTPTTTPPNSSVPPAPVSPPAPTAPPQSIPVQSATPTTPGVAAAPAAGDKAPTPSTTPSPAPQPASTPAPPSAPANVPPVPSVASTPSSSPTPATNNVPNQSDTVAPTVEKVTTQQRTDVVPNPQYSTATSHAPTTTTAPPAAPVTPPTAPQANVTAPSVADASPFRTPSELPDPKEVASASVNGNPLYTPQIDSGLQQLLEEWPLFNKSGLFGTGPKGREHPLFKKLADLQIPLIVAGRFEGATPAIKQSITDYMNGWRYEQGLLYEKGETFEQYLRRVIKHIIDWQDAKDGS